MVARTPRAVPAAESARSESAPGSERKPADWSSAATGEWAPAGSAPGWVQSALALAPEPVQQLLEEAPAACVKAKVQDGAVLPVAEARSRHLTPELRQAVRETDSSALPATPAHPRLAAGVLLPVLVPWPQQAARRTESSA